MSEKSAVISPCGTWRYRLERVVSEAGIVFAYFGVNPSTANAEDEDQTTMKWRGFTVRNGGRRYIAGNPFAFRCTDVRGLARAADPIGPDNDTHLQGIIADADVLVPCWGAVHKVPRAMRYRFDHLLRMLRDSRKPVLCFGRARCGSPKHPLMLGYETSLVPFQDR
jgi:hypothetical protein